MLDGHVTGVDPRTSFARRAFASAVEDRGNELPERSLLRRLMLDGHVTGVDPRTSFARRLFGHQLLAIPEDVPGLPIRGLFWVRNRERSAPASTSPLGTERQCRSSRPKGA